MTLSIFIFLVDVLSKSPQEMVKVALDKVALKTENAARAVFRLGFHVLRKEDFDYDSSCQASVNDVRQQEHTRRAVR